MKIVIPDHIDATPEALEKIRQMPAKVYDDVPTTEAQIIERIHDAEIITANWIDITPVIIDGAPQLKYIMVPAVGYEWVDVAYAVSKGVTVVNCPTFNSRAVAEHAMALLLGAARRVPAARANLIDGHWNPHPFKGFELEGSTLGLVGHGHIGKQIEKMARGLGMEVMFTDSKSTPERLDKLMANSDAVVLCLPLNDSTRGIVSADRLKSMKSTAVLVNVGRGAVVDQAALKQLLEEGQIAGAGLDVFVGEPLSGVAPDAIVSLAKLPNVIATPHIGFNTTQTTLRMGDEVFRNLVACLENKPINVVGRPA